MNSRNPVAAGLFAVLLLLLWSPLSAGAESRRLAAPVYPGSVPGVLPEGVQVAPQLTLEYAGGTALDCQGTRVTKDIAGREIAPDANSAGPWCLLTPDPIDKVKTFYEKSIGPMRAIAGDNGVHGYQVFAERAWFEGEGEASSSGFGYRGVSIHALPAPANRGEGPKAPAMGDETFSGQEEYGFYTQTRFFGLFLQAVDFFGDPTKRPVSDLDKLYDQHSKIESALFQRKGAGLNTVDVALTDRYTQLMGERNQAAQMNMMSSLSQAGRTAPQAGPTESEDAEFNAIMQRNPELAQRYVALTQQANALMMQGKFDEADAIFEEIEALEQSNPELKALANEEQARADEVGAQHAATEKAILARGASQSDDALWGTGLEYIQALEKEAYYTLIVIDNALTGKESQYTRDRGVIDRATADALQVDRLDGWGIRYQGYLAGGDDDGAAPAAEGADAETSPEEENLGDKAKKAINIFKRPF